MEWRRLTAVGIQRSAVGKIHARSPAPARSRWTESRFQGWMPVLLAGHTDRGVSPSRLAYPRTAASAPAQWWGYVRCPRKLQYFNRFMAYQGAVNVHLQSRRRAASRLSLGGGTRGVCWRGRGCCSPQTLRDGCGFWRLPAVPVRVKGRWHHGLRGCAGRGRSYGSAIYVFQNWPAPVGGRIGRRRCARGGFVRLRPGSPVAGTGVHGNSRATA